jgi:hypothetical protein
MSPTLLFLGDGAFVAPALRFAREAGLETVLVAPDARASARKLASTFHALPLDDAGSIVALARGLKKDSQQRGLLGVVPADRAAARLLAPLAGAFPALFPHPRALERVLDPARTRGFLEERDVLAAEGGADTLELRAFFRDGAFVPGGLARRRTLESGDELCVQPSGLAGEREHEAYRLVERTARTCELERGPLQARLVEGARGLSLVELLPFFADALGSTHVARMVYGKSPLQAWFAHLAGAGGPFDEQPLEPRRAAGWLALRPARGGLFAGLDGTARLRARHPAVDLWVAEPGRELGRLPDEPPPAYLWTEGFDAPEVEERLHAARAELVLRTTPLQRVA